MLGSMLCCSIDSHYTAKVRYFTDTVPLRIAKNDRDDSASRRRVRGLRKMCSYPLNVQYT